MSTPSHPAAVPVLAYDRFIEHLAADYPKTAASYSLKDLVIPTLIAPKGVELPKAWFLEAEMLVSLFFNRLREAKARSEELRLEPPVVPRTENASALMSYDFHVDFSKDPAGRLCLIEINTNASMSLLVDVLSRDCTLRPLKEEFLDDFAEEIGRPLRGSRVAIVDDAPESQKLYVEFLLYKELFESRGAETVIADRSQLEMRDGSLWAGAFGPIDLVYNRSTDFYFEEEKSRALREALVARAAVISPNPYDYRQLADKNRLVEWSQPEFLESAYGLSSADADKIRGAVLRTREVSKIDPETLWKERKGLVFKPRTAYGGKGVFRGSSISRGAFEGVLASDSLAQDFVPAPTVMMNGAEFKYDLRFFAYRDRIHVACARLYQGQMTNATTPGGGVACIRWL